jgi:hypothetical protein
MQLSPNEAKWLLWCVEDDDQLWDERCKSPVTTEEANNLVAKLKELASHAA